MASTVPNFQAANTRNRLANREKVKRAAHSNGTDGVRMKEIMRITGLSKITCQQHIYALEEVGQVERTTETGHAVRYGPRGTWKAHEHVREKTAQQVARYGTKAWESHLELEAWANHVPVHLCIPANQAQPIRPAGPNSVWSLAA